MRTHIIAVAVAAACAIVWTTARDRVAAQNVQVPIFEYDPTFPKPLPENWAIGPIGGHRRRSAGSPLCRPAAGRRCGPTSASPAPTTHRQRPTAAFRPRRFSNSIRRASWCTRGAGRAQGYDWPQTEHGVFVDHKDIGVARRQRRERCAAAEVHREGKFLQQFGKPGTSGGSADTQQHGRPGEPHGRSGDERGVRRRRLRQPARHRARRRDVRVQADVGRVRQQARRHADLGPYNPDAPPAQQFRLPHNISISRDGFVYVADRPNNRIQVFRKDGTYVKEVVHLEADAAAGRGVGLRALTGSGSSGSST